MVHAPSWRVFGALLAGAVAGAVLASGQLATWADAHADQPGGEVLADLLHRWDDRVGPLGRPRAWLHRQGDAAVDRRF